MVWLLVNVLRPLNTKYVVSETFPNQSLGLVIVWKLEKQNIKQKHKHRKLKPGFVASYTTSGLKMEWAYSGFGTS